MNQLLKKIGLFGGVLGTTTALLSPSVMAYTENFVNPTISGLPVDATPVEWNGVGEAEANRDAANLFCESRGFERAVSWTIEKNTPATRYGTARFSIRNGTAQHCDSCRWNLETVRCYSDRNPLFDSIENGR